MPESTPVFPNSADVVIIGGGIIGCSTACFLARAGKRVVVCEKGAVGAEQSGRNWGFIRKQGRHPGELPMMIQSLALWHEMVPQMEDIGFTVGGTLYLSETEARYKANQTWLEHAAVFGLDSRYLGTRELSKIIPALTTQPRGGLYTPSDARAEPGPATRAIARLATRHGAVILEHCAVRGLDIEAGRATGVVTEKGRIAADATVCAGGAWSSYFCRGMGIDFPQLKVVSSVMSTTPGANVGEACIWSRGMGMRRRQDGGYNIAFGGFSNLPVTPDFFRYVRSFLPLYKNSKETVVLRFGGRFFNELAWPKRWTFDGKTPFEVERVLNPKPNLTLLSRALKNLKAAFPTLANLQPANAWAGMIDVTPDELPVISAVDSCPGLIISTGYSGHGFGLGPGAGKATADLVLGNCADLDLSAFALHRHLRQPVYAESGAQTLR